MEPDGPRQVFLLLSTIVLMFGIGTGLKASDFTRLLSVPRAATVGLLGQLVLLPLLGLLLSWAFSLPPLMSAGVILLCACPGGLASNMLSLLARADVALSVTLTTASTLLAALTLPAWLLLTGADLAASPLASAARITGLTLAPTLAGMALAWRAPGLAARAQRPFRVLIAVLVGLTLLGALASSRQTLLSDAGQLLPVLALLNLSATAAAALVARAVGLSRPQVLTIALEVGLQNAPLALTLALATGEAAVALPAVLYGMLMMTVGVVLMAAGRRLSA